MLRIAVLLFAASLAIDLMWVARDPSWWLLPAALAGWYVADLASGVVHMWMDYRPCRPDLGLKEIYFYEGSRVSDEYIALRDAAFARLGPIERLVYDFKNHHPRPDALGRRDMRTQVGSSLLFLSLPFTLSLDLLGCFVPLPGWLMAMTMAALIGGTFAQYFHGTLHRERNPWIVRAMRRTGLLLTPARHQLHHATLQRDFSTVNGWSNPLLNRLFAALRRRGRLPDAGLEPG